MASISSISSMIVSRAHEEEEEEKAAAAVAAWRGGVYVRKLKIAEPL